MTNEKSAMTNDELVELLRREVVALQARLTLLETRFNSHTHSMNPNPLAAVQQAIRGY